MIKIICSLCGKELFGHPHRKYCDECRREREREYWRERHHRYYEANRDKILENKRRDYIKSKLAVLRGENRG